MKNKNLIFILSIVVLGILLRLIPETRNFSPFLSLTMFAGLIIKNRTTSIVIPVLIQIAIELVYGYNPAAWSVFLSIILINLIGRNIKNNNFKNNILGISFSNLLFFVLTNFGSWIHYDFYSKDLTGLINCYVAAIPFLKNSFISGILFTSIFYFVWKYLEQSDLKPIKIT